jgi:hypothetical protein
MTFEIRKSGWYNAKSGDHGAIWMLQAFVDPGTGGFEWRQAALIAQRFGERTFEFDSNLVTPVHAYAELRNAD